MSIVSTIKSVSHTNGATHTKKDDLVIKEGKENVPVKLDKSMFPFTKWTTKAIAGLALLLPLASSKAEAANNPQREKAIASFAEESWTTLKQGLEVGKKIEDITNRDSLWNNIQAVFYVSDDTMIEAIEPIRTQILEKGASNPNIPHRVVHGALYTTATTAKRINLEITANEKRAKSLSEELKSLQKQASDLTQIKASLPKELQTKISDVEKQITKLNSDNVAFKVRRDKMASTVLPYLGKVIVDTKTRDGLKERHLVSPQRIGFLGRRYSEVEVYSANNFDKIAGFALGNIAEGSSLEKSANELLLSGNDTERRNNFFDVFLSTPSDKLPKSILDRSKEWVFGNAQLKAYEKIKQTKSAPKEMPKAKSELLADTPPQATPMPPVITPPPIPNPGLPPGARVGSIEGLKEIDEKLVSPLLPYPFSKDNAEQEFIAKNILLLAQNGNEFALPAASQWFAIKPYSADSSTGSPVTAGPSSSDANFIVLQALAKQAQKDKVAFEVLKRVCASFPNMFADAYFSGAVFLEDTLERRAGVEIIKAFSSYPNSARELITQMADKNAKLIWPEPASQDDVKVVNDSREIAKRYALLTMAHLDKSKGFTPYLRNIVQNPFAQIGDQFRAAIGVALAKDKESIEPLLKLGVDENVHPALRDLALIAAVYIDTPDLIPEPIRKKAASESPFSPTQLSMYLQGPRQKHFTGERKKVDFLKEFDMKNPFRTKIETEFTNWLKEMEALNKKEVANGGAPITISDEDKLLTYINIAKRMLGGNASVLASKAQDANFKSKYLAPMVNYMNSCRERNKSIDAFIATSMMDVLSKANYEEAAPTLAHIATYPEQYAKDNSKNLSIWGLLFAALDSAMLKAYAIEDLGGTVTLQDANDPSAQVLHKLARKESSRLYRWASRDSLEDLADRYNETFKVPIISPKTIDSLIKAMKTHGDQVLGHMAYHQKRQEILTQVRLTAMHDEFTHAKIADKFGVTKELLTLANEAAKKDQNAPIIRSVIHALIANGKKASDLKSLGYDEQATNQLEKLFRYIDKQEYWLGDSSKHVFKGEGAEIGVLDGGYVYPIHFYPELQKRIIYPENLITWSDMVNYLDLHPTAVAVSTHKLAPESNIRSYSWLASIPEVPYRSYETQDPGIFALEDMAQLMLEDKANINVVNHSYGYLNLILNSEKVRTEWVDMFSAFMEILSRMDVKHSVAAGNEHGVFPAVVQYGGQGERNGLGDRHSNDGKATHPDGIFTASAMDKYANMLAEFTSKQNPLRVAEAVKMLSFQGVHVIAPWVDRGKWVLEPVNGTSFAAPHEAAILAWGIEARKKANLPSLTNKEWQEVFERSAGSFPDREAWEGGKYFDATLFLNEVFKVRTRMAPLPTVEKREAAKPQPASVNGKK